MVDTGHPILEFQIRQIALDNLLFTAVRNLRQDLVLLAQGFLKLELQRLWQILHVIEYMDRIVNQGSWILLLKVYYRSLLGRDLLGDCSLTLQRADLTASTLHIFLNPQALFHLVPLLLNHVHLLSIEFVFGVQFQAWERSLEH